MTPGAEVLIRRRQLDDRETDRPEEPTVVPKALFLCVEDLAVVLHNPRDPARRRFLIGSTDGGRVLTLVIEQTVDPTTWLIATGWGATAAGRRILSRRR